MKKTKNSRNIFGAVLISMLLFVSVASASSVILLNNPISDGDDPPITPLRADFTHHVLGEQGSATWCPHCPSVIGYLDDIYTSGLYDFYYVALVDDKNTYAAARINELGITGFPTVKYDGGYRQVVGGGTGTGPHITAINQCGDRVVADVELNLTAKWLGSGQIRLEVNVTNNETTAYNGHLHAYVTEIDSRWNAGGHQYHFAMVGAIAFNQNIVVPAFDTAQYSTVWDGALYGVGDIERENIMVITSVFSGLPQRVDETTATIIFDDIAPEIQLQGQSASAIQRGKNLTLFAQGKDNEALEWATLATDETGSWQNVSGAYGSPIYLGGIEDTWIWSNFTWENPAIPQETDVNWRIYYEDINNNVNASPIMTFNILSTPVIEDSTVDTGYTGDSFTFNVSVVDDHGVDTVWVQYRFGLGEALNESMFPTGFGDFYEKTITIPYNSLDPLYYTIAASDTKDIWSTTEEKEVTINDNIVPELRRLGQNNSIIPVGASITLYAQGKDNILLDYGYLSTNESGEWIDYSGGDWWNIYWDYAKPIIIDHTLVADDLTNFPVLITHTSADFIANAQPSGNDFVFVDATNTTPYNHEIEYYNSATGELVAWVNVTSLSSTEDTILYLYYGNETCPSQENVPGTWSDFALVHHMTGSTFSALDDSSPNGWDITSAGGDPTYDVPGKAGFCVDFDGTGDYLQTDGFRLLEDSSHTGSGWVYVDGGAGARRYLFEGATDSAISLMVWTSEFFRCIARTETEWPSCDSTTLVDVGSPTWHYVVTRANADLDELELFINGVREGNTTLIGGAIVPENAGLNIGTRKGADRYYMDGKIDEVRISTNVRSDAWIETEYNNLVSPSAFMSVGAEDNRPVEKYDSPMPILAADEWRWSNFTWQNASIPEGSIVGWRISYKDSNGLIYTSETMSFAIGNGVKVEGSVSEGGRGASNVTVTITNLDTGEIWLANTDNDSYDYLLNPAGDISPGETLRIIARDTESSVNITDHVVTIDDISSGTIHLDLILDIHYRDLKKFPWYEAEDIPARGMKSGAAVGKMFLDYFAWNSSNHPEPVSLYDQAWVFDNFTSYDVPQEWIDVGLNWYEDPDYIDMYEMWLGTAWAVGEYGYHFWAHANESSSEILRTICVMTDYTVPTDEGHPQHVGAAIPAYGDYSNWMAIRGIHTDRNTWDPPTFPPFEIYGFWINDPMVGGIGENTYKTVDELLATYFLPMNLPGDPFEDGKFTVLVEPPEDFTGLPADTEVVFANQPGGYSPIQQQILRHTTRRLKRTMHIADKVTYNAALESVQGIFTLDGKSLEGFIPRQITHVKNLIGTPYKLVVFDNIKEDETLVISLDAKTGQLKEFTIGDFSPEYLKGVRLALYEGGYSAFHPVEL